jgi:hypothetical protein
MENYEIIDYNWIVECEFGGDTQAYREGKKFYIDWSDYDRYVKEYCFRMNNKGYVMYSSIKDGLNNKRLHRVIMNCPEDMVVDHINHDKLNNCRSNLRICTNQQNLMNVSKYKSNKSGVSGVCWFKPSEKWQAYIRLNNKLIHLGYFDNFEEASRVRKEAEKKYYGEFRNKDNE